jgi:hypothetical protein
MDVAGEIEMDIRKDAENKFVRSGESGVNLQTFKSTAHG